MTQPIPSPTSYDGKVLARIEELEDATTPTVPETFDDLSDGTTNKAFTDTEKTKLGGIAANATANSPDATLLSRSNHTGSQAISTVTGLQTALDGKASVSHTHSQSDITGLASALSALSGRLDAIEAKSLPKHIDVYTGTTDSNGDVTITFTSGKYSSAPALFVSYVFNNNNYGTFYNIKSISASSASIRVHRNKDTPVLIGGNVDPDEPLASTSVKVVAIEF